MADLVPKARETYSILGLWSAGCRMYLDEYSKDDAIEDYMQLHPDADETAVRDELDRESEKLVAGA